MGGTSALYAHVSLELASLIKQCVYLLSPAIAACNSNVKYLFTSVFEAALIDLWPLGGQGEKSTTYHWLMKLL